MEKKVLKEVVVLEDKTGNIQVILTINDDFSAWFRVEVDGDFVDGGYDDLKDIMKSFDYIKHWFK